MANATIPRRSGVSLPTAKTPPKRGIQDLTILLYGAPKIGKSTFASYAEGAIFLATEPGLNHLGVYQIPIASWQDMADALALLEAPNHGFKTVIIDTIDNALLFATAHVCRANDIQHESDLEWGKGYKLVEREFHAMITRFAQLPMGLILISHAIEKEVKPKGRPSYTYFTPSLPERARNNTLGMVDMVLFVDIQSSRRPDGEWEDNRVIRTKGSAEYEAGDRTGLLPATLPLDYGAFLDAFTRAKGVEQLHQPVPTRSDALAERVAKPAPEYLPHQQRIRDLLRPNGWTPAKFGELLTFTGLPADKGLIGVPPEAEEYITGYVRVGYEAMCRERDEVLAGGHPDGGDRV